LNQKKKGGKNLGSMGKDYDTSMGRTGNGRQDHREKALASPALTRSRGTATQVQVQANDRSEPEPKRGKLTEVRNILTM